jgi:thiol-disulfide isomerase/thioredoxin
MTNYLKTVFFLFAIAILFSNCTARLKSLSTSSEVMLIPSKYIDTPVRTRPGESPLQYKSYLYKIEGDTFRITVIDNNRNGKYNDSDDVFVISSSSPSVPIFSFLNPNVANYSVGMLVSYKEHHFQVGNISEKGDRVKLKFLKNPSITGKPIANYTDYIDTDHHLENVYNYESKSIREMVIEHPQQMIYFHFWWTACAPCFNEIPFLQKLEEEGVLVVNIASKERETHEHLLKTITKHEYPGLHYYGNPELVREFSQNGYPFGVLVESKSGKKLISENAWLTYESLMK